MSFASVVKIDLIVEMFVETYERSHYWLITICMSLLICERKIAADFENSFTFNRFYLGVVGLLGVNYYELESEAQLDLKLRLQKARKPQLFELRQSKALRFYKFRLKNTATCRISSDESAAQFNSFKWIINYYRRIFKVDKIGSSRRYPW